MKNFLLLLGADQYLRERALAGARQVYSGEIWTTSNDPIFYPNRYFDRQIHVDAKSGESLLNAIQEIKKSGWIPDAVVPLNDWTLEAAAYVNERLGLNGLSAESAKLARDKILMKKAFKDYNVPTADFHVIKNIEELKEAVTALNGSVIIKPSEFGGSGGVSLAHNYEEAIKSFNHSKDIMEQYKDSFHVAIDNFLIESFIDSDDEVSCEVICSKNGYQVLTITEKYLSPRPYFAEIAHLVPSHRHRDEQLKEIAILACKALKIDTGLAHVEVKIKNDKYYVIEVGARPGGDGIMDQVERSLDINPYTRHILSYLGKCNLYDPLPLPKRTSVIAFLKAKKGNIKKIQSIPAANLPEEIVRMEISKKAGDYSEESICWRSREGNLELTYSNLFDYKTMAPVELANRISEMIFEVEI